MKPNPIHRVGTKNVLCPHYTNCLDHAVRRYWQFWDCSQCTHRSDQESLVYRRSGGDADQDYDLFWSCDREGDVLQ